MSTRLPVRPFWTCAGCGQHWPCRTRRQELTVEFDRSSVCLGLYMSSCFVEASRHLPHTEAGDLYYRFLGWIRT